MAGSGFSASAEAFWLIFISVPKPPPKGVTLDLIRSHLSHEISAKLARLSGMLSEWKHGRQHSEDAGEVEEILEEIQRLTVRHARLAAEDLRALLELIAIVQCVVRMRRTGHNADLTSPSYCERFSKDLSRLEERNCAFVERLSRKYGVRFSAIVQEEFREARRHSQAGRRLLHPVVEFEIQDRESANTWIPRCEAGRWHDLLRNLLRNAIEATAENMGDHGPTTADGGQEGRRVTGMIRSSIRTGGPVLEIADQGVGMTPDQVEMMWTEGQTRHGWGRGLGLTESKRAFLRSRADLEVRSAPGMGTCFRIEVLPREISIAVPPLWSIPAVALPALMLLITVGVGLLLVGDPDASQRIEAGPTKVTLVNHRHQTRYVDLGETVMTNAPTIIPGEFPDGTTASISVDEPLPVLRDGRGKPTITVVSTQPATGSGNIWALSNRAKVLWQHRLAWRPPIDPGLNKLTCPWMKAVDWDDERQVVMVHIRDNNDSPTVTQFYTAAGESLGAYYHWGHLNYCADLDLDNDGRREILLQGISNDAQEDPTIFSANPRMYIYCLILLEIPNVDGQAYPYLRWDGIPRADEEGYVLFPPLDEALKLFIVRVNVGDPRKDGRRVIDVVMFDGRIYRLDDHLRPLSCDIGDFTAASRLDRRRPLGPIVYITHGQRTDIDMEVPSSPAGEELTAR